MSVDELLKSLNNLSEPELDNVVQQALFLRARRKGNVLTAEETALFHTINQGIPSDLHQEYLALVTKRDNETISDTEYDRMLELGDQIDELAAKRAEALAQLAAIRQIPLMQLMDDLGIQGPGVR